MFDPLFSTAGMTDRELQQKIFDMSERISRARAGGISDDIINRMYMVLQACDDEVMQRSASKEYERLEDEDKCVFDTDEYLKSEEDKQKKHEGPRKQIYKSGW